MSPLQQYHKKFWAAHAGSPLAQSTPQTYRDVAGYQPLFGWKNIDVTGDPQHLPSLVKFIQ